MPKAINIQFCGALSAQATRLKKVLIEAFPGHQVTSSAANGTTSKIEVALVENGQRQIVWSKGKADTEAGHQNIISNLRDYV